MKKVKLEIVALSFSQTQSGAYALVLGESGGKRRLPIIIGGYEAQAIAIELEKMAPSRPLTHDLFKSLADSYQIELQEVLIYKIVEGVFYAKLLTTGNDQSKEVDARTSDAIALALRFDAPIYTFDSILSTYGILLEDEPSRVDQLPELQEESSGSGAEFGRASTEELNQLLEDALSDEDYEKASRIRDELKTREK